LGSRSVIKVDVRILAATNINIPEALANKRLREDLYYRLNAFTINVPPLRERKEEIPILLKHFMTHMAEQYARPPLPLSPTLLQACQNYSWPGNIRELKNVVERAMILSPEGEIDAGALPEEIRDCTEPAPSPAGPDSHLDLSPTGNQYGTLRELEERYIQEVLALTGNNKTQAAHILGIHPTSLLRRLKKTQADDPEPIEQTAKVEAAK
jgi:DNA-binding NtrC family response regulator